MHNGFSISRSGDELIVNPTAATPGESITVSLAAVPRSWTIYSHTFVQGSDSSTPNGLLARLLATVDTEGRAAVLANEDRSRAILEQACTGLGYTPETLSPPAPVVDTTEVLPLTPFTIAPGRLTFNVDYQNPHPLPTGLRLAWEEIIAELQRQAADVYFPYDPEFQLTFPEFTLGSSTFYGRALAHLTVTYYVHGRPVRFFVRSNTVSEDLSTVNRPSDVFHLVYGENRDGSRYDLNFVGSSGDPDFIAERIIYWLRNPR